MSRIDEINAILDGLGGGATYEQVEYALRDYEKREVLDVLADRSLAAGGSFNGGTITEPLVVENTDQTVTPLVAQAAAGQTAPSDAPLFSVLAPDGDPVLRVIAEGALFLDLGAHPGSPGSPQQGIRIDGAEDDLEDYIIATDGNATVFQVSRSGVQLYGSVASREPLYVEPLVTLDVGVAAVVLAGSAGAVRVLRTGHAVITNHAAPADAELAAGELALWFDQTNGAAKLKLKGKSANGTVVSGEVALT